MADLEPGMVLEGTVSNVTNFGAFVDIGVHQDGLVHISRLADRFVKDPHAVVKSGDLVKVKVLEVDLARKRIALSMRLSEPTSRDSASARPDPAPERRDRRPQPTRGNRRDRDQPAPGESGGAGALAAAFERARKG